MKRYEHLPVAPPFVQAGGSAALLTFGANTYRHYVFLHMQTDLFCWMPGSR